MLRLMSIAVAAFAALTLGAMAAIYVVTAPGGAPARPAAEAPDATPAPATPPAPLVIVPPPSARAAAAPPVEVKVEVQPPPVAADLEQRTSELLAFREVRRGDAMDQLNAREARRRQRLGLPPPPPASSRPPPAASRGPHARFTAP